MQVNVTLWGNLRRFAPRGVGTTDVEVPSDTTVLGLAARMGAEHEVFAAALNGKVVPLSAALAPGDRVVLFDHLHGG